MTVNVKKYHFPVKTALSENAAFAYIGNGNIQNSRNVYQRAVIKVQPPVHQLIELRTVDSAYTAKLTAVKAVLFHKIRNYFGLYPVMHILPPKTENIINDKMS